MIEKSLEKAFLKEIDDTNHNSIYVKGNINDKYFRDIIENLKSNPHCYKDMIFDGKKVVGKVKERDYTDWERLEDLVKELNKNSFLDACKEKEKKYLLFFDIEDCQRQQYQSDCSLAGLLMKLLESNYRNGYKIILINTGYNENDLRNPIKSNLSKNIIFRQNSKEQYYVGTHQSLANYVKENNLINKEHFTVIERSEIKRFYTE